MPRQDIMYILYTKYLQTENKDWRNVFIFVSLLEALKLLLCTEVYFKLFTCVLFTIIRWNSSHLLSVSLEFRFFWCCTLINWTCSLLIFSLTENLSYFSGRWIHALLLLNLHSQLESKLPGLLNKNNNEIMPLLWIVQIKQKI